MKTAMENLSPSKEPLRGFKYTFGDKDFAPF